MGLTVFEMRLAAVLAMLALVQGTIFGVFFFAYHLPDTLIPVFILGHVAYHLVLAAALWAIRGDFRDLGGNLLTKIGVPNLLTLFRLTSLPVMTTLFLLARSRPELAFPLVLYIAVAFLTDLLDGFFARTFGWGTQLGKLLDSSTDYLIVFSLTVVLGVTGVLAPWLLVLIIVRLGFQVGGLAWMAFAKGRRLVETTLWGKASLFVLMVLFAVEILVFLRLPGMENSVFVLGLEVLTGVVMVVSTVDKALFFRKNSQVAK